MGPNHMPMRLYINVDHVATVRQARRTDEPDPVEAAAACLAAGADGITLHLREDRRHIQDHDVRRMAEAIAAPLNLELASADDIVELALELKPYQATFVPERREEITTEGGLNLKSHKGQPDPRLVSAVDRLRVARVRVSLFVDPDPAGLEIASDLGVDAVELHTGEYANAFPRNKSGTPLERLIDAARRARTLGMDVHAGHGLTSANVTAIAAIPEVEELSIGHHIVSRAILVGIDQAVREMRRIIDAARVDQSHEDS